jgi:hypothetical protein
LSASEEGLICEALSGVKTVEVIRTELYWDGGSVGVFLKGSNGTRFEIRAINSKISPDRRRFLFSLPGWKKAATVEESSACEELIVDMLAASRTEDKRGSDIISHLRSMILNRRTSWGSFDWRTSEYLAEQLQDRFDENK